MEKVKGDFNMAKEKEFNLEELQVVKRNGKKVDFNETKIALAIKKAFDDVLDNADDEEGEPKYSEKDMQKIFHDVLDRIKKEYVGKEKIKKFKT